MIAIQNHQKKKIKNQNQLFFLDINNLSSTNDDLPVFVLICTKDTHTTQESKISDFLFASLQESTRIQTDRNLKLKKNRMVSSDLICLNLICFFSVLNFFFFKNFLFFFSCELKPNFILFLRSV